MSYKKSQSIYKRDNAQREPWAWSYSMTRLVVLAVRGCFPYHFGCLTINSPRSLLVQHRRLVTSRRALAGTHFDYHSSRIYSQSYCRLTTTLTANYSWYHLQPTLLIPSLLVYITISIFRSEPCHFSTTTTAVLANNYSSVQQPSDTTLRSMRSTWTSANTS